MTSNLAGTSGGMILFMFIMCFLPFIIAIIRKHNAKLAIFVLNFLLGWTIIGWIIALIWACNSNRKTKGDQES